MSLLGCAMERRGKERAERKWTGVVVGVMAGLKSTRLLVLCTGFENKTKSAGFRVRSFQNEPHGPKTEDMLFGVF